MLTSEEEVEFWEPNLRNRVDVPTKRLSFKKRQKSEEAKSEEKCGCSNNS
jgi:hypothetical protein